MRLKDHHVHINEAGGRAQGRKDPGMDDTEAKLPGLDERARGPEKQVLLIGMFLEPAPAEVFLLGPS